MSEAEGRFRERRSAHTTEDDARPTRGPEARPVPEGLGPGREGGAPEPAPGAPGAPEPAFEEPVTSDAVPERDLPEGPFFDVVQYIVLRASQCLGEIPLDETGERRVLRVEAKQYIDLLSRLRDLLRNDLSPQAARALDGVLTDLRTRYLELV